MEEREFHVKKMLYKKKGRFFGLLTSQRKMNFILQLCWRQIKIQR